MVEARGRGRPSEKKLLRLVGMEQFKRTNKSILDYAPPKHSYYPIDYIEPNNYNVNSMSKEEFERLKESIRITKGKYLHDNPLKIWRDDLNKKYIIIDGEHRWRACKELGIKRIPATLDTNTDFQKAKVLNVVLSINRGNIDHFKLSKVLNEEYKDENGKRKCTQKVLVERFGIQESRIKHIMPIYRRLKKFFEKSADLHFFSNDRLETLASCKNDFLREKLIEESIKNKWSSKDIRKQSTKFNKLSRMLDKEVEKENVRECILNIFGGASLFELNIEELWKKIFYNFIENKRKSIIIKYFRKFSKHSDVANNYKERYVNAKKKENPTFTTKKAMEGWYKEYITSDEFKAGKLMSWDFFNDYYNNKVPCWWCKELITSFDDFVPHHEPIEFSYLWSIVLDGDEKIHPVHNNEICHQRGMSKDWKRKGELKKSKDIEFTENIDNSKNEMKDFL